MSEPIIVYARGLWSHPKSVEWIVNNIQAATGIQVELFDYHEELVQDINNQIYKKRIIEKYGDYYGSKSDKIILYGHSHGGALGIILNKNFGPKKLILSNPALQPWGMFRQIPNRLKQFLKKHNIGSGYIPHYIVKYDGEIEERLEYFTSNINFQRDLLRILSTGSEASKLASSIQTDLLLIQSMKDEFLSVNPNLSFYNQVNLPESENYQKNTPTKKIIKVENGEHAIMEEEGQQELYKSIDDFIKKYK